MFHFDTIKESPITLINSPINILEFAISMKLMLRYLWLLLFRWFFYNLFLYFFFWTHFFITYFYRFEIYIILRVKFLMFYKERNIIKN